MSAHSRSCFALRRVRPSIQEDPGGVRQRFVERVQVKGKDAAIDVVEVFEADSPEVADGKTETGELLDAGLQHFIAGDFPGAIEKFESVLAATPDDAVAALHLERARELAASPPPDGWDGVHRMVGK